MRSIVCLFLFLGIFACKTLQTKTNESDIASSLQSTICPENGTCTFEVIPNANLNIKKDAIGMLYPEISKGKKQLLKFEFKKKELPNTVDGFYSEIIYLELPEKFNDLSLKDKQLQEVNLLFGRLCYCKGETGYYKVTKGTLHLGKTVQNQYQITLDFQVSEVPQIIQHIQETFPLK